MAAPRWISRRTLLAGAGAAAGLAAANRPLPAPAAAGSDETVKIDKPAAHYQDHPKGEQRCAICLNFEPPGACRLVRGPIAANGWCQFFAAREHAH